ncbi:MAG: hypothetical protein AB2693_32665, partial [Candidatus Thiodiazotropha sp.]
MKDIFPEKLYTKNFDVNSTNVMESKEQTYKCTNRKTKAICPPKAFKLQSASGQQCLDFAEIL